MTFIYIYLFIYFFISFSLYYILIINCFFIKGNNLELKFFKLFNIKYNFILNNLKKKEKSPSLIIYSSNKKSLLSIFFRISGILLSIIIIFLLFYFIFFIKLYNIKFLFAFFIHYINISFILKYLYFLLSTLIIFIFIIFFYHLWLGFSSHILVNDKYLLLFINKENSKISKDIYTFDIFIKVIFFFPLIFVSLLLLLFFFYYNYFFDYVNYLSLTNQFNNYFDFTNKMYYFMNNNNKHSSLFLHYKNKYQTNNIYSIKSCNLINFYNQNIYINQITFNNNPIIQNYYYESFNTTNICYLERKTYSVYYPIAHMIPSGAFFIDKYDEMIPTYYSSIKNLYIYFNQSCNFLKNSYIFSFENNIIDFEFIYLGKKYNFFFYDLNNYISLYYKRKNYSFFIKYFLTYHFLMLNSFIFLKIDYIYHYKDIITSFFK